MISRDGLLPILYPEFKIPEATEENTVKANQFHLLFTEELANINQQVQTQINENKLDIVPKPSILQHNSSGSDHQAFSFRNIPVLWFFTGLHPYYHTPEDEIENINLDKLTEITKAIYLITTHLANQKE